MAPSPRRLHWVVEGSERLVIPLHASRIAPEGLPASPGDLATLRRSGGGSGSAFPFAACCGRLRPRTERRLGVHRGRAGSCAGTGHEQCSRRQLAGCWAKATDFVPMWWVTL